MTSLWKLAGLSLAVGGVGEGAVGVLDGVELVSVALGLAMLAAGSLAMVKVRFNAFAWTVAGIAAVFSLRLVLYAPHARSLVTASLAASAAFSILSLGLAIRARRADAALPPPSTVI